MSIPPEAVLDTNVLEAAVAASCRYLVTFNTSDFPDAGDLGVDVVTPSEFLQTIH
jgi:predicted nucleic acid-binding protein